MADNGDEDDYLAVVNARSSAPIAVVARELTPSEVVLDFLKSGSQNLSIITPILDAAFKGIRGYGTFRMFSTPGVLKFGMDLEAAIVRNWSTITNTQASSPVMDDGFLVEAEMDKLPQALREAVTDCIQRRPMIKQVNHPMLGEITWMTPLVIEMVMT